MRIIVNGKATECPEGIVLSDLLQQLGLDVRTVVVEYNRNIVKNEELSHIHPVEGDSLELVRFVGGG